MQFIMHVLIVMPVSTAVQKTKDLNMVEENQRKPQEHCICECGNQES